ncbi:MAG: PIN domain-containing protein, partial [Clostridiales bacterium]
YSNNGKKLTFDLHQQIVCSHAKFDYFEASIGGKNALDHQLSSYLGFLIGNNPKHQYYIISKDQGYKYIINFWRDKRNDIAIELIDSIKASKLQQLKQPENIIATISTTNGNRNEAAENNGVETSLQVKPAPLLQAAIKQESIKARANKTEAIEKNTKKLLSETLLLELVPDAVGQEWIAQVIKYTNNSSSKADLYNKIRSLLGQDKGSRVYNAVKKFL